MTWRTSQLEALEQQALTAKGAMEAHEEMVTDPLLLPLLVTRPQAFALAMRHPPVRGLHKSTAIGLQMRGLVWKEYLTTISKVPPP